MLVNPNCRKPITDLQHRHLYHPFNIKIYQFYLAINVMPPEYKIASSPKKRLITYMIKFQSISSRQAHEYHLTDNPQQLFLKQFDPAMKVGSNISSGNSN